MRDLIMCDNPWKGDHPMQIFFNESRGEILSRPPLKVYIPEIREIVGKCFQKDPNARPRFSEPKEIFDVLFHCPEFMRKQQSRAQ